MNNNALVQLRSNLATLHVFGMITTAAVTIYFVIGLPFWQGKSLLHGVVSGLMLLLHGGLFTGFRLLKTENHIPALPAHRRYIIFQYVQAIALVVLLMHPLALGYLLNTCAPLVRLRKVTQRLLIGGGLVATLIAFAFLEQRIFLIIPLLVLGMQFGVMAVVSQAFHHHELRVTLDRRSQELLATQTLLRQSSRLNERQRIAQDIHDGVGHKLTALSILLDVEQNRVDGEERKRLAKIHSLSREVMGDIRSSVYAMSEDAQSASLAEALAQLCDFAGPPKVRLDLELNLAVPTTLHEPIFRSVQEALTNALRHAQASTIDVTLSRQGDDLVASIEDNGRGFDPAHHKEGLGLTALRQRVEDHGGTLRLDSSSGEGTRLTLTFLAAKRKLSP